MLFKLLYYVDNHEYNSTKTWFCVLFKIIVDIDGNIARLESMEDNLTPTITTTSTTTKDDVENENNSNPNNTDNEKKRTVELVLDSNTATTNNDNDHVKNKKAKIEDNDNDIKKDENIDDNNDDKEIQVESNKNSNDELSKEEKMVQIQQELEELIGSESTNSVIQLLNKWDRIKEENEPNWPRINPFPPKGIDDESKFVVLPLIEDKQIRKNIHEVIKSNLMKDIAMSDTEDKKVRIWYKMFEKQMPNYKKFGTKHQNDNANNKGKSKRETWPNNRPNFLRFVMYKENIDTTTAIKDMTRIARIQPKGPRHHKGVSGGITYAGMKDKRGVTTQYCTVFRKTPEDLLVMNKDRNNNNNNKTSKGGGGNTKNNGACIIRVGQFSYVRNELRLGLLNGNRFDIVLRNVCIEDDKTLLKSTSNVERMQLTTQILKQAANAIKETGFINFFGMQRFGKFHDTHLVGIAVLKGDFKTACDLIMRVKPGEQERYKQLRIKWENRFNNIDTDNEEAANDAEMNCAKEMLKGLGRFMNCEVSIMHSLSRKPRDYKKAFGCITKHMRSMFLHAYQSYLWNHATSYRIESGGASGVMEGDLVLVETKQLDASEKNTSGLRGKKIVVVSQDDAETGKYKITDVVLPLIGRKVELPTNSIGDLFKKLLQQDGLSLESFDKIQDRELALGGDYRKIICKPTDVDFEIKLYKDPLQPLIKTDLMTIHGEQLSCVDVTTSNCAEVKKEDSDELLVAMVIGFTLPPSAYATIALRELMKRPTSTEYQSGLNLDGDCEISSDKK